jgi:hypothetical protein
MKLKSRNLINLEVIMFGMSLMKNEERIIQCHREGIQLCMDKRRTRRERTGVLNMGQEHRTLKGKGVPA